MPVDVKNIDEEKTGNTITRQILLLYYRRLHLIKTFNNNPETFEMISSATKGDSQLKEAMLYSN